MTTTMCLAHLAEAACNKRPIMEDYQDERVNTEAESLEPSQKKVRFEGVEDDSSEESAAPAPPPTEKFTGNMEPAELDKLIRKVRRRAERRKRRSLRSPPPPPPSEEEEAAATSASSSMSSPKADEPEECHDDLAVMQRKLERMEHAIKKSARMELQLMNQSKKLRDERALLTRKYESMAQQLREMQRSQQAETGEPPVLFEMGPLPPLMTCTPRRVSASKEQMTRMTR